MNKIKITIIGCCIIAIFLIGVNFVYPVPMYIGITGVFADEVTTDYLFGGENITAEQLAGQTGLEISDPRQIIAKIIKIILGFLGIVAVILILYGGFLWMTAAGNEENIAKAKKLLMAGVIGLVIILSAFAITNFVLNSLMEATGAETADSSIGNGNGNSTTETKNGNGNGSLPNGKLPNGEEDVNNDPAITSLSASIE